MNSRDVAIKAHEGQQYGDEPYDYHLDQVVEILTSFGFTDKVYIDSGYLHDTLEDTSLTLDVIIPNFGDEVGQIVWACSGFGKNRKARVANILEKVRFVPKGCVVKAADRIANVENAKANNHSLFLMYVKEKDAFIEAVGSNLPQEMLERLIKAHDAE